MKYRLLSLTLLVALVSAFVQVAAQAPAKKPPKPEIEDPDPKPVKTKVVRPDDDPVPPPAVKQTVGPIGDLATAARLAAHPALRELYRGLATPHDLVTMRLTGRTDMVEPIPQFVGAKPRFKGAIRARRLLRDFIPGTTMEFSAGDITSVETYEQIAETRVERFIHEGFDRLPEKDSRYLSRQELLQAGAHTLEAIVGFHESARARGLRVGEGWSEVEESLRQKLLKIEVDYLNVLATANDWDTAAAAVRRLIPAFPSVTDREQLAEPLVRMIDRSLRGGSDERMKEGQRRLRLLEEVFPDLKSAQRLGEGLQRQAQALFDRAKQLIKEERLPQAQELLRQAEDIYPRLPDLHDFRLRLENRYPILRVGVRELPVNLSPPLACTDTERQAVDLLFEGLVKLSLDPESGQRYEPGLSEGRPRLVPVGRQFQLARDAYWSVERRVTAADVRNTVRLLKDPSWPGYRPSWDELVEGVQLGSDPFQVSLRLRQGFIDPLSLMTFKVLPETVTTKNLTEFNSKPTGSGPYRYVGQPTIDNRPTAVFVANPNYGSRSGKRGLPHIREIHLVRSDNPVVDFAKGRIDLLLDVPPKRVKELEGAKNVLVPPPLPSRRVWFLAVNHRRPALRNQDLRRALGLAVPREKILDDYFRPEPGREVHKSLNGPFPADSWACDPNIPSLDRLDLAKARLKEAERRGPLPKRLSLKYPDDDPRVTQAMEYLAAHLSSELGIEIEREALAPHVLREVVEKNHSYDLAYYHYDYPGDSCWLWPMFNPSTPALNGGGNFLGYANDSNLERWFREAMSHRDFRKVQEYARLIHGEVEGKMLLIPLWQLDTYVALHRSLKPVPFDPLQAFSDIDQWRLERR